MTRKRTIIIGDVHGMLPELDALLDLLGPTRADTIISAGDLVDKGPESAGVVRRFRTLRDDGYGVVLVLGNHEEKHERFRKAIARDPEAQPKVHGVDEMRQITAELLPEDIAFLDSAVLYHPLPEHGALVVHGGILPDQDRLPTPEELRAANRGTLEKHRRMLRVRHLRGVERHIVDVRYEICNPTCDPPTEESDFVAGDRVGMVLGHRILRKGEFLRLGEEGPEDPFWASVYDGRFGHVYFGHSPFVTASDPVVFPHATGLDLGAVFGGRLAAAVLEVGREPTYASTPSRGKFATGLWEES